MRGYQAHEALTSDVKMYFKLVLVAVLLGLAVQAVIVGVVTRRAYVRQFTLHLDQGPTFRMPPAALLKLYLPTFRLFGRENRIVVLHYSVYTCTVVPAL